MISVSEALVRVLAQARRLPAERVVLADAAGRVLCADVEAARDQPPFEAAAMDGYAVPVTPETGARYRIIGTSRAGERFAGRLGAGEAVRVFTGAPIPEGATRVIIQEDVACDGTVVLVQTAPGPGHHIRPAAGDFAASYRLAAPRRLRPAELALAAAMGAADLSVSRRPLVSLLATGDELVLPGTAPGPDQIYASNGFALKAMAEAAGAQVQLLEIVPDTVDALGAAFAQAQRADVLVTIGGASVGDHDLVARVAESCGMERSFYKVAMRPGKPLMAGRLGHSVLLGLPGNPVSAIVCAKLFLVPLIEALQGLPDPVPRTARARAARDLAANGPRAHYMRARLTCTDGLPEIDPFDDQDSARLTVLAEADALLIRPASAPLTRAGEVVEYLAL